MKVRSDGSSDEMYSERPAPALVASSHPPLSASVELRRRAEPLIPGISQTFSKAPTQFVQGVAPNFIERAQGCRVWDVDGNEYIDLAMALGPVILGHNYPVVTAAVAEQMIKGTAYSLPHRLEVDVAELLAEIVPCAEMVRFGKNGSDATSGAVRLARAYTNRDVIACCGYHGWQDWYIGTTTRNLGVPKAVCDLTIPFAYNDLHSLDRIFKTHPGRVAAVIMEPVGVTPPDPGFLETVKDRAHAEGALLIFDEVVTGFRISLGGAQELYDVMPDLACVGKAMANGFPISAVVGRRDVMALMNEIFFSFTFGGEAASLAAAQATIHELRSTNALAHIAVQGERLKNGYNILTKEFGLEGLTKCIGLPARTVCEFQGSSDDESLVLKSVVQQECLKRGVLFTGAHNLCYSHSSADINQTLHVYRAALAVLKEAITSGKPTNWLEGTRVEPVFRRA